MHYSEMRVQFDAALALEAERHGPAFGVEPVVGQFAARDGAPHRATLYRWAAAYKESGRAGQHLIRKIRQAAVERAASLPDPTPAAIAASVAEDVVPLLPAVPEASEIAKAGGTIAAIELLQEAIRACRLVMANCYNTDGTIRLNKVALAAAEHMRRCVATAATIQEQLLDASRVEQFHAAIMNMLRQKSPQFAEEVLAELRRLHLEWSQAA